MFRPFTAEELAARAAAIPVVSYPDLPVSARRHDIADAIRDHQVVIVSGETGSGKTTQLPKICLQLGRGVAGMIGHTQPRRLAAHSVAERIADELGQRVGSAPGEVIGYQVRFTDRVGPTTLVKLMTDGILLAEIQSDPLLRRYDTLIIDEAHERSLNIDFILGYLARLLPLRPDLKVIITSATIDSARFAEHFGRWEDSHGRPSRPGVGRLVQAAPVIEVSGRTYPVEIRYRPLAPTDVREWSSESAKHVPSPVHSRSDEGGRDRVRGADEGGTRDPDHLRFEQLVLEDADSDLATLGYGLGEDIDQDQAICDAVDELSAEGEGDILVFLPGERDIRDVQQALSDHLGPRALTDPKAPHRPDAVEILPLFARLTAAEQHRVFESHPTRRVVLATNVAETSLTVPGIRYVIDPGLARISRYSTRTKVQRLPIEEVSRASANQRAGRCGRVADGIAIRLYSQEDYESRPEFTEPEILRTSLASVILQMASLGLGAVADFPFLDPPDPRAVRDGIQSLVEIGALSEVKGAGANALTPIGRDLATLPIDPRLGRMLIEGDANGCASDVLVIVAALSIQDVRERPLDHQQAADAAHARFQDPSSDFVTYLNLWRYLNTQARDLSGSAFRRMCRGEFLHYMRFREWRDVVNQLRQMARPLDLDLHPIGIPTTAQVATSAATGGIANATARAVVAFTDSASTVDADQVHRSLLVGLLSNLGTWDETKRDYLGARGTHFTVWPGSGLARSHTPWVMAAELVETSRLFARTVARIRPEWIEPLARPLLKHVYSEPFWSAAKGAAMAKEKVLLYGMTLVAERPVLLGRLDVTFGGGGGAPSGVAAPGTLAGIAQGLRGSGSGKAEHALASSTALADALSSALAALGIAPEGGGDTDDSAAGLAEGDAPDTGTEVGTGEDAATGGSPIAPRPVDNGAVSARELAREMFIRHAMVGGEWRERHPWQRRNDELLDSAREVERRSRSLGLVADEQARFAFFDDLLPADVVSAGHFNRWWKQARRTDPDLLVYPEKLLLPRGTGGNADDFPDHWVRGDLRLPLSYQFTPGSMRDGVTMEIPVEVLPRMDDAGTDWLVPGMEEDLATEMIRALPKAKRRLLAPAPEVGAQVYAWIRAHEAGSAGGPDPAAGVGDTSAPSAAGPAPAGGTSTGPDSAAHEGARGSGPAPDDPRSLDAAMARLANWGATTGTASRRGRPAAPAPEPESAPPAVSAVPSVPAAVDEPLTPSSTPDEGGRAHPTTPTARAPFARMFARAVAEVRGVDLSDADLAHARENLPDHLRMTFVVVDARGRELGTGPSLVHLQRTLASQADKAVRSAVRGAVAEAFAEAAQRSEKPGRGNRRTHTSSQTVGSAGPRGADPAGSAGPASAASGREQTAPDPSTALSSLDADGLTSFPERHLPRAIESRTPAGVRLRGFPALVPQGDAATPSAGVRLMANPAEADRLHRLGLAHLLLARVRLATGRVTTRWTGRQALMLAASPYGDTAALVADAQLASALALVDELSGEAGPASVRDHTAFESLAARARDAHEDRVHDILGYAVRAMEALSEVQGAMRDHPEDSMTEVVADVRGVVESLVRPGFLSRTPAWALPHLARYLRAGAIRIDRASQGPGALARDLADMDRIHEVADAVSRAEEDAASRPLDAARAVVLERAQWAVQELRVSVFAQTLGTPQKVSSKRILSMVAG